MVRRDALELFVLTERHHIEARMDMNCVAFQAHLAKLLRDQPRGTSAELTDYAIAYWDGIKVVGIRLRGDTSNEFDERFDLDDEFCAHSHAELAAWLANPRYSWRLEVLAWLKEAPPFDSRA